MGIVNKFDATIDRMAARAEGVKQSHINGVFREALGEAGKYWIENYLPRHFERGAYSRYGYASRSPRYNWRKENYQKVRVTFGPDKGELVPPARPTGPLVYTGRLREHVLANRHMYRQQATSKFDKASQAQVVKLEIRIGLPHPINPRNAGELTRLNREEWNRLRNIVHTNAKHALRAMIRVITANRESGPRRAA